jgi:hypothetical protein
MEQEVHGHVKKVYKAWKDPRKKFWDKVKEIILEICIIVFAVSLSIWLHSWSEKRHEQAQVKTFLTGLKADLENDIDQAKFCIKDLQRKDSSIDLLSQKSVDSILQTAKKNGLNLFDIVGNNSWIRENNNRYEGFKSSGKIDNIEDDSLAFQILFYYQGALDQLKTSERSWLSIQKLLHEYLGENFISNKSTNEEFLTTIKTRKGLFLLERMKPWSQFYERYNQIITTGEEIIKRINKTYDLK